MKGMGVTTGLGVAALLVVLAVPASGGDGDGVKPPKPGIYRDPTGFNAPAGDKTDATLVIERNGRKHVIVPIFFGGEDPIPTKFTVPASCPPTVNSDVLSTSFDGDAVKIKAATGRFAEESTVDDGANTIHKEIRGKVVGGRASGTVEVTSTLNPGAPASAAQCSTAQPQSWKAKFNADPPPPVTRGG